MRLREHDGGGGGVLSVTRAHAMDNVTIVFKFSWMAFSATEASAWVWPTM